jgi:hypothetical protein
MVVAVPQQNGRIWAAIDKSVLLLLEKNTLN